MSVSKLWTAAIAGLATIALGGCPAAKSPAAGPAAAISPILDDVWIGDPAAPIEIVEYGSLSCPHCRDFWMQDMPQLKARYIDTGKAKYTFRELTMAAAPALSDASSAISRCAGKDKYYDAVNEFFVRQYDIQVASSESGGAGAILAEIGQKFGLTREQVRACVDDDAIEAHRQKILREKPEAASGLPSVLINGERVNALFPDMVTMIDAKLGANAPPPLAPPAPDASPTTRATSEAAPG